MSLKQLREAHAKQAAATRRARMSGRSSSRLSRVSSRVLSSGEASMLGGWRARAHAQHAEESASLGRDLRGRIVMDAEEQAETQRRLVEQLLTSVRERICHRKVALQRALAERHERLCVAGQATRGGGLLPLGEWRVRPAPTPPRRPRLASLPELRPNRRPISVTSTCEQAALASVLDVPIDWEAAPQGLQNGLAATVPPPAASKIESGEGASALPDATGGTPHMALDLSLYPAVRIDDFLERFYVAMRSTATGGVELAHISAADSELLSILHEQAMPLRKALTQAASSDPAAPTLRRQSSADGGLSRNPSSSVPLANFISTVEALILAAEPEGAPGPESILQLVEHAPRDGDGGILYNALLDSLVIVDRQHTPGSADHDHDAVDVSEVFVT